MKALTKERLMTAIEQNFNDGATVLADDWRLKAIFEQLGDDYFIENNEWVLTNKNDKWN